MVKIHRGQLKNAPYNPRVMDDKARGKLKRNLQKVGLLEPVIWNIRSGNLVGGHQRLAALDTLEGSKDYFLEVAQVDLDDKTEREQNVFLNNAAAQGTWDMVKLGQMYRNDKIDIESSGFDLGEIRQMFGDNPIVQDTEKIEAMAENLRALNKRHDAVAEEFADKEDPDYYLVVVFKDRTTRKSFTNGLGLPDNRYVDGRELLEKVLGCSEMDLGDLEVECDHCQHPNNVKAGQVEVTCVRCKQAFTVERDEETDDGSA